MESPEREQRDETEGEPTSPPDPTHEATTPPGNPDAAEGWALTPHRQLRGITPAEAIQYKGYASTVRGLLDQAASRPGQESFPDRNRAVPHVIEGGRKIG